LQKSPYKEQAFLYI